MTLSRVVTGFPAQSVWKLFRSLWLAGRSSKVAVKRLGEATEKASCWEHVTNEVHNTTLLLNQLLNGYDKRFRPDFGVRPTCVSVNMNIRSMGPITETEMAYQMDCYFRQIWVDRRLRFSAGNNTSPLSVSNRLLERIWKPDTHFYNGKRSYLHTVTFPNNFIRIYPDGRILYSMRLTIQASCPMRLEHFPMDVQTCPLFIISHGYSDRDLVFHWTIPDSRSSIVTASDMTLSQFDLIGWSHTNSSIILNETNGWYYSMLKAEFRLRRHTGYFLINLYVPCSLMVVISWVAFWINREATSDRIALGVTTVLTMAFLGLDNRNDLPKVSYFTALDYFVATCFLCVLGTIIEFAAVHYFTKHGSGEVGMEEVSDSEQETDDFYLTASASFCSAVSKNGTYNGNLTSNHQSFNSSRTNQSYAGTKRYRRDVYSNNDDVTMINDADERKRSLHGRKRAAHCLAQVWHCLRGKARWHQGPRRGRTGIANINSVSRIDQISRVLFPLSFFIFHVFYWMAYLDFSTSAAVFPPPK